MEDFFNVAISGVIGAVLGAVLTVWYQGVKDKAKERRNLFRRLLSAKGYLTIPQFLIDDLNTLEIIFLGKKSVIEAYHAYHKELCRPQEQADFHKQKALYWDLLREMGESVGYKNLDNKTLQGYYIPHVSLDAHMSGQRMYDAQLDYYQLSVEYQKKFLEMSSPKVEPKKKKKK
jgi:hypothetical protein